MTFPRTLACLVIAGLPMLSACSSTKSMVADMVGPPQRQDEKLPEAAALDQERTRKLYLLVVDKLRRQGSARAALSYLDEYDRQYPNDPESQLMRADCLVNLDSVAQAEPVYTALLRTRFKPAAYAGLGKVAVARSDWGDALTSFQQAVALSPSTPEYVSNLAYAQMRAGQYEAALGNMRQAEELDPGNVLIRNNMILCLRLSGRNAEAQARLNGIPSGEERQAVTAMMRNFATANSPPPTAQN